MMVCFKQHKPLKEVNCENCQVYLEWFRGERKEEFKCPFKVELKRRGRYGV